MNIVYVVTLEDENSDTPFQVLGARSTEELAEQLKEEAIEMFGIEEDDVDCISVEPVSFE